MSRKATKNQVDSQLKEPHPVHKHFHYDKKKQKNICNVSGCELSGRHASNLSRHICRQHKDVWKKLEPEILKFRSNTSKNKNENDDDDVFVTVKIKKSVFEDGCVEMVTKNCRAYKILNDSGFKRIVDPILHKFNEIGHPIYLDADSIKKKSRLKLEALKKEISEEMKGKLLSLKIDLSSKNNRCILGINASYFINNIFVNRCLAMKNMRSDVVDGLTIAKMIKSVLEEYGSSVDSIYSVTSDNGSNVLRAIEILKIFQNHILDEYIEASAEDLDPSITERVVQQELERQSMNIDDHTLFGVRCSSHRLDLAIDDAIAGSADVKSIISSAKEVARNLRTRKIMNKLEEKGFKKPVLSNETRWSSEYYMVFFQFF